MLTLVAPEPLAGLERDNRVMALLSRIALRADELLSLTEYGAVSVPAAHVRADAQRIKDAADEARRALAQFHMEKAP